MQVNCKIKTNRVNTNFCSFLNFLNFFKSLILKLNLNLLSKIFKNYSKFIFCNSGTEAIFKTLRIARTVSKKEKIDWVNTHYGTADVKANTDDFSVFFHENTAIQEVIDGFSENTISNFILPYGIAPNFLINGVVTAKASPPPILRINSVPVVIFPHWSEPPICSFIPLFFHKW